MQTKNNETEFDKLQSGNGTWSSINIFLFANGQKYSPPRKYNLRASELDWWGATLNYLARSQYGSKHTNIELYSIDGKKIEGPMELSNGSAYVAVEPPDSFVQSGYEKYLIKATRSQEKRQEKRTSGNTLTKPDKGTNINHEKIKPADNDSTNIQIIQDIRIQPGTATASNKQDQTVITVKSDSVSKAKQNGVASTTTTKQIPKRKLSGFQQRPSILRKSCVNSVPPPAHKRSRDSRITKVDLNKNKLESSSERPQDLVPLKNGGLLTTKITESKLESTIKVDSRTTAIQPPGRNVLLDKKEHSPSAKPITIPLLNSALEIKSADIDIQKDEVIEKDILSVSFHSEENFQSVCINANNSIKENLPIAINETTQSVLSSTPAAVSHHSNFGPNQFALPSRLPSSTDVRVTQKNHVVSDSQTTENIIISISPGDTVKLKLNIAFENSSSSTDTPKNEFEPQIKQPSPAPLATKPELESPGRHVLEVHPSTKTYGGETPTNLTKSWQTTFTNENIEELNDVKLAVCRCNCCLNSDEVLPARATPVYVDNNNYFIILPSVNNNEKFNGCNCGQENSKNNSIRDERHLILPKAASSAVESESVEDKETLLLITRTQSKTSQRECPTPELFTPKNQNWAFEGGQSSKFVIKCCVCDDTHGSASESIFQLPSTNNHKIVTDNSTQTNWDNILLEARVHKDGHYTFHMPPLDKLKI